MTTTDSENIHPQSQIAFLMVVAIGYAIALAGVFADSGWNPSPLAIAISIFLGAIYMGWAWWSDDYFERFPFAWAKAVYFGTLMALILTVQIVLGANGTWLLPLPLVAEAVERLQPLWRWPVYMASWLGLALPIWMITGSLGEAVGVSFAFIPAVFFVVVFTHLRLNEQRAREKAERLTDELEQANRQLAGYAFQAEEMATTQERNRLAREIHDNLGHYLTVVNVQIEAARVVLHSDPVKAKDALEKAQKLTKEGLTAVRQSVSALRESPLDDQTLVNAIQELAAETRRAGIVAEFVVQGDGRRLPPETKLALYRVTQEALTNVRKHARASRVDVMLDFETENLVKLTVRDNGVGSPVTPDGGFGLIGIRERVQALGGELKMETAVGKGFALETAVPG